MMIVEKSAGLILEDARVRFRHYQEEIRGLVKGNVPMKAIAD